MAAAEILFINKSQSPVPADVVFFEPAGFYDSLTVRLPWLLIVQCPFGFSHPFEYSTFLDMRLRDDWGNYSPPVKARPGTQYAIRKVNGIETIEPVGPTAGQEIEVLNELDEGAPSVVLSRNGRITAIRGSLTPGEFFSFRTPDVLLVRKVSGIEQARRIKQLEQDGYSTLVSLKGVNNAELLMTGGGSGSGAKKYSFSLEQINQLHFDHDT